MVSAGTLSGLGQKLFSAFPTDAVMENTPFQISLAEWSLNRAIREGKLDNMDFPRVARERFKIDCVEFVDQFFADKAKDKSYLAELKKRADNEGVRCGLIMVDTNGPLGVADKAERDKAVEKTLPWIDAAAFLGCRAVRVNAYGVEDANALRGNIAESCARLADYAADRKLDLCIENHGHLSSDPDWLASVMKAVGKPNFGTLPDFGNFPAETDRYDAVEKLMPFAKAVSAKCAEFNDDGSVKDVDFFRMMRIVRDGGYTGYVGIESCPPDADQEFEAVAKTRDLLSRIREAEAKCKPLFNGRDLSGWVAIEGGDWTVENGVLIGRNGCNWTTNPETTGSWLRTEKIYGDFRLELQYAINQGGNSGVFFRSAPEKNPAFTGYEMQIVDFFGQEPSKHGATAIYDLVPPMKNKVRPADEWNTVTITARGPRIQFEINGELVLDSEQTRSMRGHIGLQNHDERAVVRFRNIRLQEL